MKKEDIEKAARSYSSLWAGTPLHVNDILKKDDFESGFEDGAEWRIESVWHNVNRELPEDGRLILGIGEDTAFICGPNNSGFAETASHLELKQWAYVDDLKPMED